ncbi:uncharacterized protein LOC111895653 [Lactuca sativa]|uniref:uncharacterized protein LOC111895653 n=1 Tax=Lactuca sativa TaxID=4236 RepID=UPI000CD8CAD4|nr:uncharacterized protein LOC111895653 [Lactuca sativa]
MKAKSIPSKSIKVTKKSKKSVPKPRSPSPVLQDKSAERTVSSPPSSTIPESDVLETIMKEPFSNLTTPPPPPPLNPPTLPMSISPITNSILILIPLSTPFFTYSIVPTTTSVTTSPEVPIIKSISEEIRTSSISGNTFDVEPNANIGVSSEPSTSIPPTLHEDVDIMFRDDQEPLDDFVFHPFTVNIDIDNDDSPITKGQFKELKKA